MSTEEAVSKFLLPGRREGGKKMVIGFNTYRLIALPAYIPELTLETANFYSSIFSDRDGTDLRTRPNFSN